MSPDSTFNTKCKPVRTTARPKGHVIPEVMNHRQQINAKNATLCVKHVLAQLSLNATPVKLVIFCNSKPILATNPVRTVIGQILSPMNAKNAVIALFTNFSFQMQDL